MNSLLWDCEVRIPMSVDKCLDRYSFCLLFCISRGIFTIQGTVGQTSSCKDKLLETVPVPYRPRRGPPNTTSWEEQRNISVHQCTSHHRWAPSQPWERIIGPSVLRGDLPQTERPNSNLKTCWLFKASLLVSATYWGSYFSLDFCVQNSASISRVWFIQTNLKWWNFCKPTGHVLL